MSRLGSLESFGTVSAKTIRKIDHLAWPNGALLICACGCGYQKTKTSTEMNEYLKGWPRLHGHPVKVKPL